MEEKLKKILMERKKPKMVEFLKSHPEYFDKAMQLALKSEPDYSWRSAWLIVGAMKKNDLRVKPYIHEVLEVIPYLEDGHQRELLKIVLMMDLEEDFESVLFDVSVELWEQVRKKSSVRHFAFKAMKKVAKKYPELNDEIILLAQPHFVNPLSPGIRKGVLKSIIDLTAKV